MPLLAPPIHADKYLDVLRFNQLPQQLIDFLKQLLKKADQLLVEDFYTGAEVKHLVTSRAWFVEQFILQLWKKIIHSTEITLVAVGGFGRGELHPFSDVDLLIIIPTDTDNHAEQISEFIQALWDIGLDVGQSVRTVKQCFDHAQKDATIATNLMEARYIFGDKEKFDAMEQQVTSKNIWKGQEFFAAKWHEQKQRHKKFSDTTYNLEPNIKEGPGGLRDIQMVSWVAQRFFETQSLHELVDAGFLTEYEYIVLIKGQDFLWRIRFALHIIAKRKEERILFDYQLKLAKVFGYHDVGMKNPAVEQFMQKFFRNAMRLERLNLRLLQLFNENILKENHKTSITSINERFHIINHFLEIKNIELFHQQPTVWFELFLLIQKYDDIEGVRADTVRAMRHNINYIDHKFRDNNQVKRQFISILKQQNKVAAVFNQMNQLGILARYLPVFGQIVGRMQFDLFHIYTVDQHSLFVLRNLCLLRHNKSKISYAKDIFSKIPKPHLVYIAALFHDIAKGREGSHSELGAIDADDFCQQHDIQHEDKDLIVWLVKDHLIMSETAQKRDLSDTDTIKKFAKSANSLLRLRALYMLTIADISATDPKLWNGFKESLLKELYIKTEQYLTSDENNISVENIKNQLKTQLTTNGYGIDVMDNVDNFPKDLFYRLPFSKLLKAHTIMAKNTAPIAAVLSETKSIKGGDIETNSEVIEFLVYCPDFKGLCYMMAAIMTKHNFTLVGANINLTKDHQALNIVQCLSDDSTETSQPMIKELKSALKLRKMYEIPITKYRPQREKAFKTQTKIKVLQSNSLHESLIEVICRDSPGLLPTILKVFFLLDISINAAKIVSVGTRAEDIFWVSINQKALTTEQLKKLQNKLLEIL